ncbi:lipopolysaccharide biosynthesis protein [Butyrivibrio sp. YAB3001]|uniref:lipopolysaccharide biosynthesis protein n=1 Tax=Butyrivibrio sp. YAB3001 TaxID=1520812 RepID=UPI0008F67260|nr:oligosaccharide flippase family protein [Butyrivibrio sp. YAB3001]SFC80299.1 Membrane protein involved in the export of O-antigen and teichoic acid [Butyrivibrio sp. YAB3001]
MILSDSFGYKKSIGILKKYKSLPVQVRASFWFLVCSFLQKGISVITMPIFTRLLSTDEYGRFGVWNSWQGIVAIVVGLSLSSGVHTQGLVKFDKDKDLFSSSLLGLMTLSVSLWMGIYFLLHDYIDVFLSLTTIQIVAMLVKVWSSSVFHFWANEQRIKYAYRNLVIITIIVSCIKPILGIILVSLCKDKVTARIIGLVSVELIGFSWMFLSLIRKGKGIYSKKYWIYALGFNLPLVPHYLSQTVLNSSDRIMIQKMVGDSQSGIYGLAYSVSLIMTLFNTALMQTISPWIYRKIKDRKENDIAPIAYASLLFVAVVNLILIAMAPEVIAVFAPKSYHEAIYVIPPVAMSVFFLFSYDLFAKFAFYYEKTKFIMTASVLGALLNVILNYFFIRKYGYIAAGYTTLICYITYALAHYLFMRRVCRLCCFGKYPYETKIILMIAIPFLLCGFILLLTYKYSIIRYCILAVFIIMIFVFRKRLIIAIKGMLSIRKGIKKNV